MLDAQKPVPKIRAPKAEKVTLDRQVVEIGKLLTLWPQASADVVEEYIEDKLGIVMTRVCLQEAREVLGLGTNQHREKTREKMHVAERLILKLIKHHGVGGLSEAQLTGQVSRMLKDAYQEETKHRLVRTWVQNLIERLRPDASSPDRLMKRLAEIEAELEELQLNTPPTRQTNLL